MKAMMEKACLMIGVAAAAFVAAADSNVEREYLVGTSGRTTEKIVYEMPITAETARQFVSAQPDCADVVYREADGLEGKGTLVVRFKKPTTEPVEILGPVVDLTAYAKEDGVTERLIELDVYLRAVNPGNSSLQFRLHHAVAGGRLHVVKSLIPTGAGHETIIYLHNMRNFQPWMYVKRSGRSYYDRTTCRLVLLVHPAADNTEVQIRALALREFLAVSHAISVPAAYNTFHGDTGRVDIAWVQPEKIRTATITLENEEKKILSRKVVPKGEAKSVVELPRRGFYRIRAAAEYADGREITAFQTALVAGEKIPEAVRRKSRYGLCNVQLSASMAMDLGSNQNYHLYNFYYHVKKGPNGEILPQHHSVYDKRDPRRPMRHLAGQDQFPAWAQHPKQRNSTDLHVPHDWDLYEKVVAEYFRTYPELPDTICWQNEPDTRFFVKDEDFVECHTRFADIVKKVRPEAKIAVYCSYGIFPEAFDRLIQKGIMKHAEWINTHNYAPGIPEGEFITRIQKLKAVLAKHGYANIPIAITEFGWSSRGDQSSYAYRTELEKARFAARSLILGTTEDVKAFCLFDGKGAGRASNSFSCYRCDNAPLPQAAAFTTVAKEFAEITDPGRWVKLAPGVHAAIFNRRGKAFWALWTEEETVQLTLPEQPVSLLSMSGTPRAPRQTLTLTPSPVYAEFADAALAACPVVETKDVRQTDVCTVADVRFAVPEIVETSARLAFKRARAGEYTVFCKADGKYVLRVFRLLKGVEAKISGSANDRTKQTVTLAYDVQSLYTNIQPVVRAAVTLEDGTEICRDAFALRGGANQRTLALPAVNGKRMVGALALGIDEPFAWTQRLPFDLTPLAFPCFTRAPIDWAQVPCVAMDAWARAQDAVRYRAGLAPLSATAQCAMDDRGLAFRVVVRDDRHIQEDLWTKMAQQDSLQVMVDLDADDPWEPNNIGGNRYQGHRITGYGFALKRDGGSMKWRFQAFAETVRTGPYFGKDCTIVRDEAARTTTYTVHLGWQDLGAYDRIDVNRQIGIAILVNDYDGKTRRVLPLFHGAAHVQDAPAAGRIKFYEQGTESKEIVK